MDFTSSLCLCLDLSADAGRLHGQPLLPHPRVNPLPVHSLPQQGFCLHQHGNSYHDHRDTLFIRFLHHYCHHHICVSCIFFRCLWRTGATTVVSPPLFTVPLPPCMCSRWSLSSSCTYFCLFLCICLIKSSEMTSVDIWSNPWYLFSDGEEAEYSWKAFDN